MVPAHIRPLRTGGGEVRNRVVERGVIAVLVIAPAALASVPVWAASIVQIMVFLLFALWLRQEQAKEIIRLRTGGILAASGVFVAILLLQLVPLPAGLLDVVSPSAALIRREAAGAGGPASLNPHETLSGLLGILSYLAVFLLLANHSGARRWIERVVRAIVLTACVLVVIAVLQQTFWNGRLYWFYPLDPMLQGASHRIWGPYINRNHFAGYLEMASLLALGGLVYRFSRTGREGEHGTGGERHRNLPAAALYFVAFILLSGTIIATLSRGGIIAHVLSTAILLLLLKSRRIIDRRTGYLMLAAVIAMMAGVAASWEGIEARIAEIAVEDRVSRKQVWSDAIVMAADFPVLGTGYGTFEKVFPRYQRAYSTTRFEHAENDYLEVLTDTGAAGLGAVIAAAALYAVSTMGAWRRRTRSFEIIMGAAGMAALAALLIHGMTDFNFRIPANALLFAAVAGLTVAVTDRGREACGRDGAGGTDERPRGHAVATGGK